MTMHWRRLALAAALALAPAAAAAESLAVDGVQRTYAVEAPAAADHPLAVVFFLHGAGGSDRAIDRDGWTVKARSEGFLLVGLQGLPADPGRPASPRLNPNIWNDGSGRGRRAPGDDADVRYFDAVLAAVERAYPVDRDRIYVAGHSNGASMALRLAAARSGEVAAVAILAGGLQLADPPPPKRPVPALMMLGELDPIVPLNGGPSTLPWGGRTYQNPAFIQTPQAWARRNGCPADARPAVVDSALARTYRWPCQVTFMVLRGQGHAWPTGDAGNGAPAFLRKVTGPTNPDQDATDLAWRFLEDKRLGG